MLKCYHFPNGLEAGCDEAGRGCLAGPVFAAAVIFPRDFVCCEIRDSKKLNEESRYRLREKIKKESLAWGVGMVSEREIDEINILNASFLAMHRAIDQLLFRPDYLLIDGNRFNTYEDIEHVCIVKGDSKYLSIAAASILAKTYRDDWMLNLHNEFPIYHWHQNKGYPTSKHRKTIAESGECKYHRKSFNLLGKK